jgi:N-acetylmuramic acid 6-phosphate etherase
VASLDDLITEARGAARSGDYDLRPTRELVELLNDEDATVAHAVRRAAGDLAALVDAVVERLAGGGRLIYAGAGSSGRLAALDAYECEATFAAPPGQVVAVVAGEELASPLEQAAAEDDREAGARAIAALAASAADAVVGVSASGRTPFVLGAVEAAAAAGALTACVVSVPDSELARLAQLEISVVVGAEFVAGSTRLKAGTAQKLVLNTLSTVAMIRLGKTLGDLMIDVVATNEKLRARAHRIVRTATGAADAEASRALDEAGGSAKVAVVALLARVDADAARERLHAAGGSVRLAVGP